MRRTHPQVRPNDAVVGAPLAHAAAVRRACHPHGAAAPVVLGGALVRLQRRCGNRRTALIRDGWWSRSKSELHRYEVSLCCWLTTALDAQEARQLALAVLLLLVGQQLVDELPDELLGRSVQHGKHVHDQSVHVPSKQTRHATSHTLIDVEPYSSSSSCFFFLVIDFALIYNGWLFLSGKDYIHVGG